MHSSEITHNVLWRPKEEPEEEPSADVATPAAPQHKTSAGAPADAPGGADEVLVQNAEDYSQFLARKGRNAPAASPRVGVAAPNFAPFSPPGAAEDESGTPLQIERSAFSFYMLFETFAKRAQSWSLWKFQFRIK